VRLGRLLKNRQVTPGEMVATARSHLLGRVAGRDGLVIQDTTSLRDDGRKRGLYLHTRRLSPMPRTVRCWAC